VKDTPVIGQAIRTIVVALNGEGVTTVFSLTQIGIVSIGETVNMAAPVARKLIKIF
jgi:hypothetical protein